MNVALFPPSLFPPSPLLLPLLRSYFNDPLAGVNATLSTGRILGGETALWTEVAGPGSLDAKLWPRAAAYGGRLWNYDLPPGGTNDWVDVELGLAAHASRLIERGVQADEITYGFACGTFILPLHNPTQYRAHTHTHTQYRHSILCIQLCTFKPCTYTPPHTTMFGPTRVSNVLNLTRVRLFAHTLRSLSCSYAPRLFLPHWLTPRVTILRPEFCQYQPHMCFPGK
jgi:hypothetical protein